jgi:hypothetical protein
MAVPAIDLDKMDELRRIWSDRLVLARADKPELKRFEGKVGRVVTVNYGGKAIVDFADGAWYDVPASEEFLTVLPLDDPQRAKFDATANSAQPHPQRQS